MEMIICLCLVSFQSIYVYRLFRLYDAVNWTTIDEQKILDFKNPNSDFPGVYIPFPDIINARYIKIDATKLTTDDYGNYYFQLADIYVYESIFNQ